MSAQRSERLEGGVGSLIDLLAQQAVEDYLTGKVGPDAAPMADRPNPVPLPDLDRAA